MGENFFEMIETAPTVLIERIVDDHFCGDQADFIDAVRCIGGCYSGEENLQFNYDNYLVIIERLDCVDGDQFDRDYASVVIRAKVTDLITKQTQTIDLIKHGFYSSYNGSEYDGDWYRAVSEVVTYTVWKQA